MNLEQQRLSLSKAATAKQMQAAEPDASVWVSASAGTGKTFVLTRRLLKLLVTKSLNNPSEFLAVTYTKAAAAEMQNRLQEALSGWAICSDSDLDKELHNLLLRPATMVEKERARQLFAQVLETTGGLNIATIHAFCQLILQQFPHEAGLEAQFSVIEGGEQEKLMQEALEELMFKVTDVNHALFNNFSFLNAQLAESSVASLLGQFIFNRGRVLRLLKEHGGLTGYLKALQKKLELDQVTESALATYQQAQMKLPDSLVSYYRDALGKFTSGGKRAQKISDILASVCAEVDLEKRMEFLSAYKSVFFKADGTDRDYSSSGTLDKKTREALPEFEDIFLDEQLRLKKAQEKEYNLFSYLMTQSFLKLGSALDDGYRLKKEFKGALDFDDLIHYTKALVSERHTADWVRFKMDNRLTHVLLDEAQDSDQDQWQILESMIGEYYAGLGQKIGPRSFFVVGDVKQAIYRFRGAERQVFDAMRDYLNEKAPQAERPFHQVRLDTSFRSGEAVVNFVDGLFSEPYLREALDGQREVMEHKAFQVGAGGLVKLWPLLSKEDNKEEQTPWALPVGWQQQEDVYTKLFEQTASQIHYLLNSDTRLYTKEVSKGVYGASVSAGDIMILLRGRNKLPQLIAALNKYGIMHVGADTLVLNGEPMVQDLLKLCRFLNLPDEELSLLQVLRSPMIGLTDEQVLELSTYPSLWSGLKALHPKHMAVLEELLSKQHTLNLYELLSLAAERFDILHAYLQRFADMDSPSWRKQIADVYNAFMAEVLTFSQQAGATPLGFEHQFNNRQVSLKRESSADEPAVRIMTAHRSKGLEAPIVFMPDTSANMYRGLDKESLLWDREDKDNFLVYKVSKNKRTNWFDELINQEKKRIFEDEMRLLYVALTRAREQLYIGGVSAKANDLSAPDSWYDILSKYYEKQGLEEGEFRIAPQFEAPENIDTESKTDKEIVMEDWIFTPPKQEGSVKQIQASHSRSATEKWETMGQQLQTARGSLVHKLLEVLAKEECKEPAAYKLIEQLEPEMEIEDQEKIINEVMAVFDAYPWVFDGQAEVQITALFDQGQLEAAMDVLVVKEDEVWVIDYKTDRQKSAESFAKYQQQLMWYKRALAKVFPDKSLKTALLWTHPQPKLEIQEI